MLSIPVPGRPNPPGSVAMGTGVWQTLSGLMILLSVLS
jgi:hypothetical protein